MIYRDTNATSTPLRRRPPCGPKAVSRARLAALYLLTADRNLWSQVRDHISLRRMYVEDMRAQESHGDQLRLLRRR